MSTASPCTCAVAATIASTTLGPRRNAPLDFAEAQQGADDIYLVFRPGMWSGVGNFDYFQFVP